MIDYRRISLWHDTLPPEDTLTPRPALAGDADVDVAIVGAGYTGLWTAYYLLRADPHLRVAVIEAEVAGFGASGRNGGWCVAEAPSLVPALERRAGREAVVTMQHTMHAAIAEVGTVAASEGIDCGFTHGG